MSEGRTGTGGTSAPTVLRMILGRRLQERRQDAGRSLEDAAKALRVTSLTIRRLEKAEVALKPLYVEKLLETYGAERQEIDEFVVLAERANEPGWWHTYRDVLPNWFRAYVSLEAGARTLRMRTACCAAASPTRPTRTWADGWTCGCAARACWRDPTRPRCGR